MSAHDCIAQINALLAEKNTKLVAAFSFSNPSRELIQVSTEKADRNLRGKPVAMFASHCPFCGAKLSTGSQP